MHHLSHGPVLVVIEYHFDTSYFPLHIYIFIIVVIRQFIMVFFLTSMFSGQGRQKHGPISIGFLNNSP